jgi:hypothetical protein
MEERFFGITRADLRGQAYRVAVANTEQFKCEKLGSRQEVSQKLSETPREISVSLPQSISAAHVKSFTKENVKKFFDLLEPKHTAQL